MQRRRGDRHARAIVEGELPFPALILPMPWIATVSLVILALGAVFAFRELRIADHGRFARLAPSLALLTMAFVLIALDMFRV